MKPSVLLDLVAQAGGSLVIDADLADGLPLDGLAIIEPLPKRRALVRLTDQGRKAGNPVPVNHKGQSMWRGLTEKRNKRRRKPRWPTEAARVCT